MSTIPRPEHPRPQLVRTQWLTLNGQWEFEIDSGDSGFERGLVEAASLSGEITVPFAPETEMSGVHHTDFMEAVWYARRVQIPPEWTDRQVLLHFGAVDHDATVWVDGTEVVRHRGGFSSFSAPIPARAGDTVRIVVRARDSRHDRQARGKQATWYAASHCQYDRTTGIWQSVWLEAVPSTHLRRLRMTPNLARRTLHVETTVAAAVPGMTVSVELRDDRGVVTTQEVPGDLDLAPTLDLSIPQDRLRVWSPQDPYLYDVLIRVLDQEGSVIDEATSYAGIRSIAIEGKALLLNGERVFQRLVLDQGYWPQSLMTAPSDEALAHDIELGLAAGFNGARLHQKVFEERYLYHADRLGYLVWGEFGDWGVRGQGTVGHNQAPTASFITQWLEVLERDHNHPAIIGWCPMNETDQVLHDRITELDDVMRGMFLATKLADPSRPVIDSSGYSHRVAETDVYDSHSYEQDPSRFAEQQAGLARDQPYVNLNQNPPGAVISQPYAGQPYFVSEFGGIWWNPEVAAAQTDSVDRATNSPSQSWGYGDQVRTEEEFHSRFAGLIDVLLDDPGMFGYCYTQLTDVMQEENGIYRYDRSEKLDVARIAAVQRRPAAYEAGAVDDGGGRGEVA